MCIICTRYFQALGLILQRNCKERVTAEYVLFNIQQKLTFLGFSTLGIPTLSNSVSEFLYLNTFISNMRMPMFMHTHTHTHTHTQGLFVVQFTVSNSFFHSARDLLIIPSHLCLGQSKYGNSTITVNNECQNLQEMRYPKSLSHS